MRSRKLKRNEVVTLLQRDFPAVTVFTLENHLRKFGLADKLPDKQPGKHGYTDADLAAIREHFQEWNPENWHWKSKGYYVTKPRPRYGLANAHVKRPV